MPRETITVRVPDWERAQYEQKAEARGWSLSRFVREALAQYEPDAGSPGLEDRVAELERRLGRVEEMAGL